MKDKWQPIDENTPKNTRILLGCKKSRRVRTGVITDEYMVFGGVKGAISWWDSHKFTNPSLWQPLPKITVEW